jgi:Ribosomal protein L2
MLNKLKPNTPGQRGTVLVSKKHLSNEPAFKTLTTSIKSSGGRNNQGRIFRRKGEE